MIWYYIILFFFSILSAVTAWLPHVDELPLGMDSALLTSVGYFNSFMAIMPPIQVLFTAFMWYVGFRVVLLTLRLLRIIR